MIAKNGLPITYKLLLAFLAVVIVLSGLMSVIFIGFSRKNYINQSKEQLLQSFNHIAADLTEHLQNVQDHLKIISANPVINEYLVTTGIEQNIATHSVEELFEEYAHLQKAYISISYVDFSGMERIKVVNGERNRNFTDISKSRHFSEVSTASPGEIVYHGPVSTNDNEILLHAAIQKMDPDIGEFAGAILITYNLSKKLPELEAFTLSGEQVFWAFGTNGQALVRPQESDFLLDPNYFVDASTITDSASVLIEDYGMIIAQNITPSPKKPLFRLVISAPENLLFKDFKDVQRVLIIIITSAIFVAAIIALIFAKYLSRPIVELAEATAKISGTKLPTHIDIKASGELKTLVDNFNRMLETLARTTVSTADYQEQSEFLLHVIESIPYPFMVINISDYSIIMANSSVAAKEVWKNSTCHRLTHHIDKPCSSYDDGCICPVKEVQQTGKPVIVQHLHKNKNGDDVFYEVHGLPIFDEQGKIIQMIEYSLNISERKHSEVQLHQNQIELEEAYNELKNTQSQMLQREKMASIGQLAAGVAHEINNPIGFISSNIISMGKYTDKFIAYIRALEKTVDSNEACRGDAELAKQKKSLKIDYIIKDSSDLIEESVEGVERVKTIVNNLKNFSRVDQEGQQSASINNCIETTLNIAWNELKYTCTVTKEYGDLPETKCYPMELNQVFMNILINAAQAIEKQGEIKIHTWTADGLIHITISDTGKGIPEHLRERIFEPFFTTKDVGEGTGLGMSISYDIIKKHNGHISVESEEGRGTTFLIEIPVLNT